MAINDITLRKVICKHAKGQFPARGEVSAETGA